MTPNKLPPLPESLKNAIQNVADFANADGDLISHVTENAIAVAHDQVRAYAAEALRQSQSLPAGAVAKLIHAAQDVIDGTVAASTYPDGPCIERADRDRLKAAIAGAEQALQADAREKGEAEYPEAAQVCAEAYQVVGILLDELGLFETEEGQKILDNLSQHRLVHKDVLPWGWPATQPAQASEKDNG